MTAPADYLRAVAENVEAPADTDAILVAFGVTPVPEAVDGTTGPTPEEIAIVRELAGSGVQLCACSYPVDFCQCDALEEAV